MLNVAAPQRALPMRWLRRLTAAACLLGAQTIHVLAMEEHFTQWLPAGLFFLAVAVLEGLLAVALIVGTSRRVEQLCIMLNLATVAVWVVSRTVGLPIGPMAGMAEPVGRADLTATILELATVAVLLHKVAEPAGAERSRGVVSSLLVVAAASMVTAFGVTSSGARHNGPPDFYPPCPSQRADASSCSPNDPVARGDSAAQPASRGNVKPPVPSSSAASTSPTG